MSRRFLARALTVACFGLLVAAIVFGPQASEGSGSPATPVPSPVTSGVWAWGLNDVGQLGLGGTGGGIDIVRVPTVDDAIAVRAGDGHSLALRADGTVWAWGANGHGQLGDGTRTNRSVAAPVVGLDHMIAIAAGDWHSLAVREDGSVWGWGFNGSGQAAGQDGHRALAPTRIPQVPDAVAVAAGSAFSLALTTDGEVWTWGINADGALGRGDIGGARFVAQPVHGLPRIRAVGAGARHALAIDMNGEVWSWGANVGGQLGDGTYTARGTPARIDGLKGARAVDGGMHTSMAITEHGQVWAWGRHGAQAAPDVALVEAGQTYPVAVGLPRNALAIAGYFDCLVLLDDRTIWGWRATFPYGGEGLGRLPRIPVPVNGLSEVKAMDAGTGHTLAIAWHDKNVVASRGTMPALQGGRTP
jgi:alpha-tubulin suppressor-like RCC1 family protein